MVFAKTIVAALAVAGTALAQSSCSSDKGFTVQNQGDASTVGACKTFTGDVNINSNAGATLDFGSIQSITGKVAMDSDSQLTTLKFSSLTNLGSLSLSNLTTLSALDLSSLQQVGDIDLINLSSLQNFNFGTSLKKIQSLTIQNVQIADLAGLSNAKTVDGDVSISNCQYLTKVMFSVGDIGTVDIGPNNVAQGLSIAFPSLKTATGLTLRNATAISTPALTEVSDTLSLIGNKLSSYSAANLTSAGAIVMYSNPSLSNISFPQLTTINGTDSTLDIENNTALTAISGFPQLTTVTGGVTLAGNLDNVTLPKINTIGGALTVLSTSSKLNCDPINAYGSGGSGVVRGAVSCSASNAGAIGTTNGSSSTGGSSGGKSAATSLQLPTLLTTGVFAAAVFALMA